MNQHTLERWSFIWSEVRLLIAAVALFLGGIPPVFLVLPNVPAIATILTLCWLISGAASFFLLYQWWNNNRAVFGGHDRLDIAAFLVCTVSGINLGLTGLLGRNIGMSISSNKVVFLIVGALYIAVAVYLYRRWNAHGQKLFGNRG